MNKPVSENSWDFREVLHRRLLDTHGFNYLNLGKIKEVNYFYLLSEKYNI